MKSDQMGDVKRKQCLEVFPLLKASGVVKTAASLEALGGACL